MLRNKKKQKERVKSLINMGKNIFPRLDIKLGCHIMFEHAFSALKVFLNSLPCLMYARQTLPLRFVVKRCIKGMFKRSFRTGFLNLCVSDLDPKSPKFYITKIVLLWHVWSCLLLGADKLLKHHAVKQISYFKLILCVKEKKIKKNTTK